MKIRRIGYTEGSLLFIYWMKYLSKIDLSNQIIRDLHLTQNNLLNWLHTTSGFYDEHNKGSYFDINIQNYNFEVLNKYLDEIYKSLYDSDVLSICLHDFTQLVTPYKQKFINSFNSKSNNPHTQNCFYNLIANKKVLIVSSFANLIKQQHESGNVKKIYNSYPEINNMIYYTSPYTFFNKGPDKNIIETCENVFKDIEKLKDDFDIAIISFGAYSNLLAHYIDTRLNKDTLTLGEQLQSFYGIISGRSRQNIIKNNIVLENKDLYIYDIPDEYKPEGYMKIENGCYW